jgi:hypothetical protein
MEELGLDFSVIYPSLGLPIDIPTLACVIAGRWTSSRRHLRGTGRGSPSP